MQKIIFFISIVLTNFIFAQCNDYSESQCNNDNSCNWIENIESVTCASLVWDEELCEASPDCTYSCWDADGYFGWCEPSCTGGMTYIDSGYCQEIETSECSEFPTESNCNHIEECEWIEDIEYEACQSFNQSNCNTINECDWEVDIQYGSCSNLGSSSCDATPGCWGAYTNPGWYYGWYCAGGTYVISDNSYCSGDIDNGYCTEAYELGDVNADGDINVIDIVELVTIILNAEYIVSGDVNQDGTNNIVDVIVLVNIVLGIN